MINNTFLARMFFVSRFLHNTSQFVTSKWRTRWYIEVSGIKLSNIYVYISNISRGCNLSLNICTHVSFSIYGMRRQIKVVQLKRSKVQPKGDSSLYEIHQSLSWIRHRLMWRWKLNRIPKGLKVKSISNYNQTTWNHSVTLTGWECVYQMKPLQIV